MQYLSDQDTAAFVKWETTDELGASDKRSASERNTDDSCKVVVPILKQSDRKYGDMMPESRAKVSIWLSVVFTKINFMITKLGTI